jgi:integrase
MPRAKHKRWEGRVYLGRDENGKQQFYRVGEFATRRERDAAVARARTERPWEVKPLDEMTGAELVDRYLERYERTHKLSSYDTARRSLKHFRRDFGSRSIASISPIEAEDWAQRVPKGVMPQTVAAMNYAKRLRVLPHNPFDGLSGSKGRGRALQHPPTPAEFQVLLDATDVLGSYGAQIRHLLIVGAYKGMRPGELFELRWPDIDFATNRITVSRRLYRGRVDVPKNGRPKVIALPPPARDALLRQPTRAGELVFTTKTGTRLTASTMTGYWSQVRARAGLNFDLYLATKHMGVHLLYKLGLSARAIAAQMGWSERGVETLLRTYGHADVAVLAEVDALYATERDPLKTSERGDAPVTQEGADRP